MRHTCVKVCLELWAPWCVCVHVCAWGCVCMHALHGGSQALSVSQSGSYFSFSLSLCLSLSLATKSSFFLSSGQQLGQAHGWILEIANWTQSRGLWDGTLGPGTVQSFRTLREAVSAGDMCTGSVLHLMLDELLTLDTGPSWSLPITSQTM